MKRYERGQGITEYAILLMLVGGIVVAILATMGFSLRKTFCQVTDAMYMGNMPEEGNDGFSACHQLLSEGDHEGEDGGHDGEDGGHDGEHGGHDGEHGFLWNAPWLYHRS